MTKELVETDELDCEMIAAGIAPPMAPIAAAWSARIDACVSRGDAREATCCELPLVRQAGSPQRTSWLPACRDLQHLPRTYRGASWEGGDDRDPRIPDVRCRAGGYRGARARGPRGCARPLDPGAFRARSGRRVCKRAESGREGTGRGVTHLLRLSRDRGDTPRHRAGPAAGGLRGRKRLRQALAALEQRLDQRRRPSEAARIRHRPA